jgi:hypothetical protein
MIGSRWSVLTPNSISKNVYINLSQGDDANDGLSELTPKKTIAAAKLLIRRLKNYQVLIMWVQ